MLRLLGRAGRPRRGSAPWLRRQADVPQLIAETRSIFDSEVLGPVGLAEACRSGTDQLRSHLFEHAEFYARHSGAEDLQLALAVGPAAPASADLLRGRPVAVLSKVIRVDGDATGAKLVVGFPDGRRAETAIIAGRRSARGATPSTICVSSQAGCAMACKFCDTGFLTPSRFALGLPAWAILEQVLHADAFLQREGLAPSRPATRASGGAAGPPANIVFMGMGEPLLNYAPVLEACRALCGGPRPRRVTVSTVGVATRIRALARDAPPGLRLALSLHAPTQDLRHQIMPVAARAWPLPQLLESLRAFEAATGTGVLLEYILLAGVNDQDAHADALTKLVTDEGLNCAGINLIPYNPTAAGALAGFEPPTDARCKAFRARLRRSGAPNVTVRFSTKAGRGVAAACGQLGSAAAAAA